jgi:hypothetical protein
LQRLLAHPVATALLLMFGIVLSQGGYANLKRDSFEYTPEHGPAQIISPATNATFYWAVAGGLLAVGVLLIAIGTYAAVCLFRACRTPAGGHEQPRFSMFTFAFIIFVILFGLIASMCSRQTI